MDEKNALQSTNMAPIRLLLIDDETGYVDVLANRLSRRNFQVGKAASGTKAFQLLRRKDFDVAVLDLKMEDMDGIEILKILKKMAPEIAVIMLTGHGSAEAAHEGIEHGAYDYLTKPCELNELIDKIHEAHKQRARIREESNASRLLNKGKTDDIHCEIQEFSTLHGPDDRGRRSDGAPARGNPVQGDRGS